MTSNVNHIQCQEAMMGLTIAAQRHDDFTPKKVALCTKLVVYVTIWTVTYG